MNETILLSVLIFAVAAVFSSVGHAGASGYLAAMALVGISPATMRPAALLLNILVASVTTLRFHRAGNVNLKILLPFALGSVPSAFIGGMLCLPDMLYARVAGLILLFAAYRLVLLPKAPTVGHEIGNNRWFVLQAVACGMGIGLLSGLIGIGGGVFLSPLLILTKWADVRQSAGIAAAFILLNSIAGISGRFADMTSLPAEVALWSACAVLGGIIGSDLGARRLNGTTLRRVLAVILVVAGIKLLIP